MDWYVINFLGDLVMYVLLWLCSFTYVLLCSLLLVGLYVIFALSWFIVFYSSSGTFFVSPNLLRIGALPGTQFKVTSIFIQIDSTSAMVPEG